MADQSPAVVTTWWIWDRDTPENQSVIVQVRSVDIGGIRVDTPVEYYVWVDSGIGVSDEAARQLQLDNERFAVLRHGGAIRALCGEPIEPMDRTEAVAGRSR